MFPSQFAGPPASRGARRTPAQPALPPRMFGIAPVAAGGAPRPENETLLATLGARHAQFLDVTRSTQSPATLRWYRDGFRNYAKFLRDGLHLPPRDFQLRVYDIDGWITWNHGRKLSPMSMNSYWRAVKLFWNDVARRDGAQHPFEAKRQPPIPTRIPKAHAPDDCARILIAAKNYPWESAFHRARALALLGCALAAGLRRGEILRLQVRDIDLADGTMLIRGGKGRGGGKDRVAYPSDELLFLLRDYDVARARLGIVCPEFFASSTRKQGISLETVRRIVRYVRAASGVRFTIHTLRHSYVSSLIRAGTDLPTVSELAGHTMVSTTMNYVRVFDADKRAAVRKLRFAT